MSSTGGDETRAATGVGERANGGVGEDQIPHTPIVAGKRVVVAMSGGVDSSVAAALLVEQGAEVIGVTMQLWSPELPQGVGAGKGELPPGLGGRGGPTGCCSLSAVEDARRVAQTLGITYYVMSFHEFFSGTVIDDFIREYGRGRTPNPCVRCNQFVKFASLMERARQLGADYLATGHYARTGTDPETGRALLRRGVDPAKDQSYALYTLTQEQVRHTLFPVGELSKPETRRRAAELGLVTAAKRDSQDICFVAGRDYAGFLRGAAPELLRPGPIIDRDGRVLGEHPGIAFFTIGQKRGLKLPLPHPVFVLEIRSETNSVVVGPEDALWQRVCVVEDANWIAIPDLAGELAVTAKVRYGMGDEPALLTPLEGGRIRVEFQEAQRAITPGQAAVFYRGDDVVGGGTIAGAGLAGGPNG